MKKFIALPVIFILLISFFHSCITPRKGPQRAYDKAMSMKPFDAIIVPGVPFKNGNWDSVMKARVIWSWVLYKNGYTKNVIYSGAAVYSPYPEAIIMGLYAEQLGIPKEHIFYDTKARHSTENVFYSYQVAQKEGFKSIALATDPFQALLLRSFCRKRFGTPIYHLPFVTDTLSVYNHLSPTIDPSGALVNNFVPLPEKESFWKRMRGTFGKDIDWSKYPGRKLPAL